MSYGIACKHCGHQEGAHADLARHDDEKKREECLNDTEGSRTTQRGYTVSLEHCEGYEPEDSEKLEKLKEAEQDAKAIQPTRMQGWRQEQEL